MALALGAAAGDTNRTPSAATRTRAGDPTTEASVDRDTVADDFEVTVGQRRVAARLLSPAPTRLSPRPLLLLNLCADRTTALTVEPYNLGVRLFLERGHRALSFDLPNHGPRADAFGEGIQGWRNAWVAGEDRFAQAVEEASAVIGRCLERGHAEAGRVVVYGISRGGYLALRLLAADARVAAAAAIAPVTDWRDLSEFAAEKERAELAELRLARYVGALAGKPIFLAIGNADERVSTLSCCRFFHELQEANAAQGHTAAPVEFHCAPMSKAGHVVDDLWRRRGAEFLLRMAAGIE